MLPVPSLDTPWGAATVPRYLCARDAAIYLDDDGFLGDPDGDWGHATNPSVVTPDALRPLRCAVIVGEPGTGKSDLLRRQAPLLPTDAAGIPAVMLDLAEYGTEDRLSAALFHAPEVLAWRAAGIGELCVVLDSLDECKERVGHISTILGAELRRWPVDRLCLRICSRTADWPESLQPALHQLFPDAVVYELLPLRRRDVAELAVRSGVDADTFVRAVHAARVGAFAAKPLTLALLLRLFARDGCLPADTAALYRDALLLLADEPNAMRRDARTTAAHTPDERVAVARRLAALSIFGQRVAFWTGMAVDAPATDLALRDCAGGTEPVLASTVAITEAAAHDALRTGLFTSRGAERVGWAHQTFAEHLAAAFLVRHDARANIVRDLLLAPDEHVYPQLRPVAAWLVALGGGVYDWIVEQDPELLLTAPVDVPDPAVRRAAVAGLFARAARGDYHRRFGQRFGGLAHPGLDHQVRAHLFTGSRDERLLAIELAGDCQPVALHEDLLQLMLDPAEDYRLRVAASHALVAVRAAPTPAVHALATAPSGADDPDDELKGNALRLCWPATMSTAQVFAALTAPRHPNLFGAYAVFMLHDLPAAMTAADVPIALDWLLAAETAHSRADRTDRLADHIVALALHAVDDPAVCSRVAELVLQRAADHQPLFVDTPSRRRADRSVLAADQRHRLLDAVLPLIDDPDRAIGLIDHTAYGPGVVTRDDLPWLIDRFETATPDERDTLSRLIDWVFHPEIPGHANIALSLPDEHPVRTEVLRYWFTPVELNSPQAEQLRRRSRLIQGDDADDDDGDTAPTDGWVEGRITAWLDAVDAGDPAGFWQACYFVYLRPGAIRFFVSHELDPDLTEQPRWPTLPAPLRERLVIAARRYLDEADCDSEAWLGTHTLHRPAYAGFRALVLLLRQDPAAIDTLDGAVWREWSPIIAAFPATHGAASWDDKLDLLTRAATVVPDIVFDVITRLVEAASEAGEALSLDRELEILWSPQLAIWLRDALTDGRLGGATAVDVARVLAKLDPDTARPLLHAALTGSDDDARIRAGSLLLAYDTAGSWPVISQTLVQDPEFGKRLVLSYVSSYGHHGAPHLEEAVLADLYIWLARQFPMDEDPQFDDAHFVGPREQAGQWRDAILRALQARGTASSVAAIRRAELTLPQYPWLRMTRREAELQTRANTCSPVAPRDLLDVATTPGRRLVNSDAQLLEVVLDALVVIQRRLTGETPESHLLWDTRSGRPKSEDDISDYLLNRLRDLLAGRGVVVNREVQVRRSGAGIGERTDLRIDAAPPDATAENPTISLAIEVKGAWNRQLLSSLRSQLVDRYMRDLNIHRGVYLVVWPDLASWTSTDGDRTTVERRPREQTHRALVADATTVAVDGYDVAVVALDVSYLRPNA